MLAFYFTWRNPDKGMPHKAKNDFTLKATISHKTKRQNHSISTLSLKTTLESLKITSFFFTECKQAFLACQHFKDVSVQKAYVARTVELRNTTHIRKASKVFLIITEKIEILGLLIPVSTFSADVLRFRFNRRAYNTHKILAGMQSGPHR